MVDKRAEVLGDRFVEHLCLTVALRVVRSGGQVRSPNQLPEFILKFVAKLFSFVSEDFDWYTVSAEPFVKQGFGHGGGFFVWNGDNFRVLGEGVGDRENVLLVASGGDQRPELVSVNSLIWFCRLGNRLQQRMSFGSLFPDLTSVAGLDVLINVLVHSRPPVGLKESFLCFVHPVVT